MKKIVFDLSIDAERLNFESFLRGWMSVILANEERNQKLDLDLETEVDLTEEYDFAKEHVVSIIDNYCIGLKEFKKQKGINFYNFYLKYLAQMSCDELKRIKIGGKI